MDLEVTAQPVSYLTLPLPPSSPLFFLPLLFLPLLFPTFHSETQTKPRALDMLEKHSMPELQSYPRMDIFYKHFKLLNIAVA